MGLNGGDNTELLNGKIWSLDRFHCESNNCAWLMAPFTLSYIVSHLSQIVGWQAFSYIWVSGLKRETSGYMWSRCVYKIFSLYSPSGTLISFPQLKFCFLIRNFKASLTPNSNRRLTQRVGAHIIWFIIFTEIERLGVIFEVMYLVYNSSLQRTSSSTAYLIATITRWILVTLFLKKVYKTLTFWNMFPLNKSDFHKCLNCNIAAH